MDIKNELIEKFAKTTGISEENIKKRSAENYFESGWLDSAAFLELITFIEEKFSVTFDADDFQNPDFMTIDGLCEIIKNK